MFTDSVFKNMDDISQMVEPFRCKFNKELGKLPATIEIDFETIKRLALRDRGFETLCARDLIKQICNEFDVDTKILFSTMYVDYSEAVYKFEFDPDTTINLETDRMTGSIRLIKIKELLTDEVLYDKIIKNLTNVLRSAMFKASNVDKSRVNEIATIFDIEEVCRMRGIRSKKELLIKGLIKQFEERRINIRDLELGFRFANWIRIYLCRGNLAAVKNLTLFKVMMLNGLPIYSLDHEETL